MRVIALEEHFIPAELMDRIWGARGTPEPLRAAMTDTETARLRSMDEAGIEVQVLSVATPGTQHLPATEAVPLARAVNDHAAAMVAAHPDRFRALASLPTADPDAAVAEARRAVRELGFVGIVLNGHTRGRFLDAPEFEPLLAGLAELDVPIYLHPTPPPAPVFDAYFGDLEPELARVLSTAAWGWHAETGLHVLRMAAGGVFDRHPALQVVIGHMGENLPFSLMRADSQLSRLRPGARSVAATVLEHVHLTICAYATVAPLQCALSVFGADRIMFATDYPFTDGAEHTRFLAEAPVSPLDREKIAYRNAEQLFGI